MQITLGRVLVSVTMLALALGLGRLSISLQQWTGLALFFVAWLLGFAAVGYAFKRTLDYVVLGIIVLVILAMVLPAFNEAHG